MKIISDCWESLFADQCQYGAHLFDGTDLKIYVAHWLSLSNKKPEIRPLFSKIGPSLFVGHCIFHFKSVQSCRMRITPYEKTPEGRTLWKDKILLEYTGATSSPVQTFIFAGSLRGIASDLYAEVVAESFDLCILERDEPAKDGDYH